ncbi:asialoglyco receptor 1-like [Pelobates cultripes]|uniref:Asialoglyco receptor 1-like n=1 Tax=Pelobates cultripes TaxID=61616 RepID=A0AAD1VXD0_PELCU|nr:asialoglyco receptor 1-like [Pelobates cultripes]
MSFFSPPPSSRLLTGLCAVYAMLLLTIIVLIVALRNQMKSGLEDVMVALGKLSDRVKKLLLNGTSEITCPDGWLYYSLSCYFISKVGKSWEESTKICKDKNSHLVVVNSEEEQILGSWPARRVLRARSWRRRGLRPYLPPRRLE